MPKGIYVRTESAKKNMSKSHKGHYPSEETRKKMSKNNGRYWLGKKRPDVSKLNIKLGLKPVQPEGFHHSEETIKKLKKKGILFEKGQAPWNKGKSHKAISGSKNHNWKNGISPVNKIIRQSLPYKNWREKVFKRDNYICQKYKIKGVFLHPHHIKNFAEHPKLRFHVNNGITLSKKAHEEFHRIYGRKNNTRKQLMEFLINQ